MIPLLLGLLVSLAGFYTNPVVYADYSDPDVVAVDGEFWMTSSSFNCAPGLQILHSTDLVSWEIVGSALPGGPETYWDRDAGTEIEWMGPIKFGAGSGFRIENISSVKTFAARPSAGPVQHGNGVYAPSIRYHDGQFWIFWGDPDYGIYQVHAADPRGKWSEPVRVIAGKGFIDPCPLWDDDGRVWLVHAWAKSRCGVNGVLHVCELDAECTKCISAQKRVFDGKESGSPVVEGPKFYKRDGWYWIFAPAGGVQNGWQLAMRSRDPLGPYDCRTVLEQGPTSVCGPHQGGWVEDSAGDSWFLHFEDRYAWGRVVHLQPMVWRPDGWPVIGDDPDGDGTGNPVARFRRPAGKETGPVSVPNEAQFQGKDPAAEGISRLWDRPDLKLEKLEGPEMVRECFIDLRRLPKGGRRGIVVMGRDYSTLEVSSDGTLTRIICRDADKGGEEEVLESSKVRTHGRIWLRVSISEGTERGKTCSDIPALCIFSWSSDGTDFVPFGGTFSARQGKWIGAKVGEFGISDL